MKVNVIRNFDGLNGDLVEVVERKHTVTGRKDGRRRVVSYKGQKHIVFHLPSVYGEISGNCISVQRG